MKHSNDQAMINYFNTMLRIGGKDDAQPSDLHVFKDNTETDEFIAEDLSEVTLPKELVFSNLSENEQYDSEADNWTNIEVDDEFQVLFFELNHVTFGVPLISLGGIQALIGLPKFLIGKPHWFCGVIPHNERLYNIVDTAAWLQLGGDTKKSNYSHYILLGESNWGLCCEKVLGTETIHKTQIRWREQKGRRPWLAGVVKPKMCVLLHVDELIKLLNKGLDLKG